MIIIDGHNLIGASYDLNLSDPKAKDKLIEKLSSFQKIMDIKIIVVFDGRDETDIAKLASERIETIFSEASNTADEVICQLCQKFAHAKDTVIVSSDNEIIKCAKTNRLISRKSKNFIQEIEDTILRGQNNDEYLSPGNLDDWLEYFNKNKP